MTQDWVGRDSPSVADVQAFEELPIETQSLAARVLLYGNYPEEIIEEWIFTDVQAALREERHKGKPLGEQGAKDG